jgi:hypothetical protein
VAAPAIAAAVPAADKQAHGKQDKGPIMIRAVATSAESVKPIMLHNDAAKGAAACWAFAEVLTATAMHPTVAHVSRIELY